MIRQKLKNKGTGFNHNFRIRGANASRLEALSDTVFGFAITLLVVSLSPPRTYFELIGFLKELPGFMISITLLLLLWYEHYQFFLKYGFRDKKIISLNAVFLFLILFYVYPLKFLFSFLTKMFYYTFEILFVDRSAEQFLTDLYINVMPQDKIPNLQILYGIGVAGIYLVLATMYRIAYNRRVQAGFDAYEIFYTKYSIYRSLMMASVPVASCIIAATGGKHAGPLAGMIYALYGVTFPVFEKIRENRRKKLKVPVVA